MDLAIVVYLIGLASSLKGVAGMVLLSTGIGIAGLCMFGYIEEKMQKATPLIFKAVKWLIIPSVVLMTLLPTKTDMYIMTGLVVGEKVLTSEKGNELLDKSYLLLVSKIEKSIEDTNEGDSE